MADKTKAQLEAELHDLQAQLKEALNGADAGDIAARVNQPLRDKIEELEAQIESQTAQLVDQAERADTAEAQLEEWRKNQPVAEYIAAELNHANGRVAQLERAVGQMLLVPQLWVREHPVGSAHNDVCSSLLKHQSYQEALSLVGGEVPQ